MIAVVDYGVGNLFSLKSSLDYLKLENKLVSTKEEIEKADKIILPGVGAFADAAKKLKDSGLEDAVKNAAKEGKALLGICLGMQLLFDKSYEYGEHKGLSLIKGEICPLEKDIKEELKIPHIGWNSLHLEKENDPLMKYVKEGDYVYFVHSYYAKGCEESLVASAEYGVLVPGTVRNKNVWGCQFHPEKSGEVGLSILKAFGEI